MTDRLIHPYILPVVNAFEMVSDAEKAVYMEAYMRNQFPFLGIKSPERRMITNSHMKTTPLLSEKELVVVVKQLWKMKEREYQYFGQELIGYHKKIWSKNIIKLIEHCIVNKSWWDTVDTLSMEGTGPYFNKFPGEIVAITGRWNSSDNIWLNRSSLLFQKSYKKKLDTVLMSAYINNLSHSSEFFIQKAIGWMLREYGKTDPGWVREFIRKNKIAPLSKREAMKHLV